MKKSKILIENKIICPECNGFGYIPEYADDEQTCRECHGSGVITKHKIIKKEKVDDGLDSIDRFVLAHQKKVIK